MSTNEEYRVYGYRWVVLAVFMFVNLTIQMLWIAYAPITGPAAAFYGVRDFDIGILAMSFMIAFIPLSIPVSWVIDTYGFRMAVGIGVILMGIFGVLRGLAGSNYSLVLACTIGLAISQPFLLNAWTKMPALWFDKKDRATAVGLITLSNLVGTGIGMAVTPMIADQMTISGVQLLYGSIAAFSAVLFLILAREKPATPPCPEGSDARALMLDGLKHALQVRDFWFFLLVAFIVMSVFNGVNIWIENIIRPRGFTPDDAGILGAIMLVGGLVGAVLIPALSDKQHKRKRYLFLGVLLSIPGLVGVTFATNYWLLMISGFVLGFFLVSIIPVGMQYAVEITHPTPEGTSNGLVQLFGQGAVIIIYGVDAIKDPSGAFTPALLLGMVLMVISALVITQMKDPVVKQTGEVN